MFMGLVLKFGYRGRGLITNLGSKAWVALDSLITSRKATMEGIGNNVAISVGSGVGEFRVNGGSWITSGVISDGDILEARTDSSVDFDTQTTLTIDIGAGSDTFYVRTRPAIVDVLPFSFSVVSGVDVDTVVESETVNISGPETPVDISIVGGEYSINGGAFTSASGTVIDGDTIQVRLTTSSTYGTDSFATLTVSNFETEFFVSTMAGDLQMSADLIMSGNMVMR